jgi:hypothetical protein
MSVLNRKIIAIWRKTIARECQRNAAAPANFPCRGKCARETQRNCAEAIDARPLCCYDEGALQVKRLFPAQDVKANAVERSGCSKAEGREKKPAPVVWPGRACVKLHKNERGYMCIYEKLEKRHHYACFFQGDVVK